MIKFMPDNEVTKFKELVLSKYQYSRHSFTSRQKLFEMFGKKKKKEFYDKLFTVFGCPTNGEHEGRSSKGYPFMDKKKITFTIGSHPLKDWLNDNFKPDVLGMIVDDIYGVYQSAEDYMFIREFKDALNSVLGHKRQGRYPIGIKTDDDRKREAQAEAQALKAEAEKIEKANCHCCQIFGECEAHKPPQDTPNAPDTDTDTLPTS